MSEAFLLILILIIYISINICIGIRIQKSFMINNKKPRIIFWIIFMLIALSYLITNIFEYTLPFNVTTIIANVGCYYLGLFVYIIILFVISFILTKIFKKGKLDYYSLSLLIAIIISISGIYFAHTTKVKEYDVQINSKIENSDSLKIALVSDIHLGFTNGKNTLHKMVTEINSLNPDVIIIAGDLIDGNLDAATNQDSLSELSSLNSKYGTFFALGNHDCYSGKAEELTNMLRSNNVNVLNDECILIDDSFYIIGRVDKSIQYTIDKNSDIPDSLSDRNDLCNIISGIDKSKPTILIDHSPNDVKESIENDIDLQLSGHTHNGQLFPFNYVVKKTSPIAYGYKKLNDTNIIVTSGYGTWGPQMRTNSHSEISLITLHN